MSTAGPTILVLAPMPALPASAGNRRRLLATCEALQRGGFAVDLAYYAHEDQIYRRFGQHPPTDCEAMQAAFRRVFLVEPRGPIRLTTRATHFPIDAWCPDEVGAFVAWYFARHPETRAILVNYVFLSRALESAPAGVLKLIDTHDRFAGRRAQYRPLKAEPNFFHTDTAGEAAGLARADIVLAIQPDEARHFEALIRGSVEPHGGEQGPPSPLRDGIRDGEGGTAQVNPAPSPPPASCPEGGEPSRPSDPSHGHHCSHRKVLVLPPFFPPRREFRPPERIARIGFLGHGNDPNVFSLDAFARAWSRDWASGQPELVVAGEICRTGAAAARPGVRPLGFVADIAEFYEGVDCIVAPMLMGTGLKMKVAEALSFGVPVIGTRLAFEGFDPVDPAHRCRDAEAVKARVLELAEDRAGLAALSTASADLFARFNRAAFAAEQAFLARLRRDIPPATAAPAPDCAVSAGPKPSGGPTAMAGDVLSIAQECSARSLPSAVDQLGVLVATERVAPDGSDAGYSPLRRRWFARASVPMGRLARFERPDGLRLALSPEWLHGTVLGEARPLLAAAFSGIAADWEARGRVVGAAEGRIAIVLDLPSALARGRHPTAAFLIAPDGRAAELRLDRVDPLRLAPWSKGTGPARPDGPSLVPAALTFLSDETPRGVEGTLLLLADDCVGRVHLAGESAS